MKFELRTSMIVQLLNQLGEIDRPRVQALTDEMVSRSHAAARVPWLDIIKWASEVYCVNFTIKSRPLDDSGATYYAIFIECEDGDEAQLIQTKLKLS